MGNNLSEYSVVFIKKRGIVSFPGEISTQLNYYSKLVKLKNLNT
jgi:hypothetical protein